MIQLCDSFLFLQLHPYVPISLFWVVLSISAVTFFIHVSECTKSFENTTDTDNARKQLDEMNTLHKQYRGREFAQTFEDKDRILIKLLAE